MMSKAITRLQEALQDAMTNRPKVGGFPYLADVLRCAGVMRNLWFLPACESLYLTELGPVVMQGTPLFSGVADIPVFDKEALIKALRRDQAGNSTFPEFLDSVWKAGVVRYEVDFTARKVSYYSFSDDIESTGSKSARLNCPARWTIDTPSAGEG